MMSAFQMPFDLIFKKYNMDELDRIFLQNICNIVTNVYKDETLEEKFKEDKNLKRKRSIDDNKQKPLKMYSDDEDDDEDDEDGEDGLWFVPKGYN